VQLQWEWGYSEVELKGFCILQMPEASWADEADQIQISWHLNDTGLACYGGVSGPQGAI